MIDDVKKEQENLKKSIEQLREDISKNYQEEQIQNKKILYTKQQILKAETIQLFI